MAFSILMRSSNYFYKFQYKLNTLIDHAIDNAVDGIFAVTLNVKEQGIRRGVKIAQSLL
jgi:hypothetical protein